LEEVVTSELAITADWEPLSEGEPEERACFASLGIRFDNVWLTEGRDAYVNRIRSAPLLSAYHLAEWLASSWWRLRWEPRANTRGWAFAHRLSTIGEGYIWPDITIFTDGQRTALLTKPTPERPTTPYRYINDFAAVVPAHQFEGAIDQFIEQVRGQLREERVSDSDLDFIWNDVRNERSDPGIAKRRKFEALLGHDPDEADPRKIDQLLADAQELGEGGVNEVAAEAAKSGELLGAAALRQVAATNGFEASPRYVVRLQPGAGLPRVGDVAAWYLGAKTARVLRDQLSLGEQQVTNRRLAELAAVSEQALLKHNRGADISFALDTDVTSGRVVLRSKWETGRRFELARLVGDRLLGQPNGKLFPATRAYTYRQKAQRSFAAELLSPFNAIDAMLDGDYSMEAQQDVAEHFRVSPLTIRTLLVNHRRIEREELDEEFDGLAA
jgi:hypothetical protein